MSGPSAAIWLRPGKDRSLRRRHPWIFSGAIAKVDGSPGPGDVVAVRDASGEVLAHAGYNARSALAARVWTFGDQPVDAELVRARLDAAAARRCELSPVTNAWRMAFSESDGLPGLVADRYADVVVVQFTAATAERFRAELTGALAALPGVRSVYERSDIDVRAKEGLDRRHGLVAGYEPPPQVEITEYGCRYLVDVRAGHKTGFYLDQRDNRAIVAEHARQARVLNLFSYTGGFGIAAAKAGAAEVINVDSSAPALALGREQAARNGLTLQWVQADVFRYLRDCRDAGEQFDLVVVDPPKLAASAAQLARATRAYKDLNWLAFRLLRPGGCLATFSCSGAMTADLFRKVVAGAALDAGRDAVVELALGQARDHPVPLSFPESSYLKGLLCRVE